MKSQLVVILAGLAIIAIALYQTIAYGAPDRYTVGALLALALGGGVGRVADTLVKAYVKSIIDPPAPPGEPRDEPAE